MVGQATYNRTVEHRLPFRHSLPPTPGSQQAARMILVVEDQPDTLAALTMILEASGYRVLGTRDGLSALEKFEKEKPDLVVLDLDLPIISGFRLLPLLRRKSAGVPVVVVTGYDYEEATDVIKQGADALITKPFDARDLLSQLEFALRRSHAGPA